MHVPVDHVLLAPAGDSSRLRNAGGPWHGGYPVGVLPRLADVTMTPDPGQLPGGTTLQQLTDGVGGWALILSLAGMVVGAAAWALGSHSQNYQQSFIGRRTVLISGLAALVIGAAPAIVNFFFHAGQGVH
jgi:Family of unknown function (DUF6112)